MKKASAAWLVLITAALLCSGCGPKTADWIKYNSPEGRYSVLLPGEPKLSTQESTTATGEKFPQYIAASQDSSGALCMVGYFNFAPGTAFSFDDGRDGMVAAVKGTLISEKTISLGDHPGRELRVAATGDDGKKYIIRAKFYQAESRVYVVQLIVAQSSEGPSVDAKGAKYFDSFQITKPH